MIMGNACLSRLLLIFSFSSCRSLLHKMMFPKVASLFSLLLAPCMVLGDTITYKGADSKYPITPGLLSNLGEFHDSLTVLQKTCQLSKRCRKNHSQGLVY